MSKNIIDKIWSSHCVKQEKNTPDILFLDLQLLHEVTSPQAFAEIKNNNFDIFDTERQIATVDHSIPTNITRDNFVDEKHIINYAEIEKYIPKNEQNYITIMTSKFIEDKLILSQLIKNKHQFLGVLGSETKIDTMFKMMLEEASKLVEVRNRYSKPTPSRLRGMSKERVKKLSSLGKSYRGVDIKTIDSMAQWIKEDEKVEKFFSAIRELEESIVQDVISKADVVLSTNGMIGAEMFEGVTFDVAIIDEASQQMEPSTLLPMMRAKKVILAGDHKQLPPTVISDLNTLKDSLFEKLMERGDITQTMLEIQYRMHKKIMDFPNQLMYDGKLKADKSVASSKLLLAKLPDDQEIAKIVDPNKPIFFLDTSNSETNDNREALQPKSTSYENIFEAKIISRIVKALVEGGLDIDDIGVITPYLAQVKRIEKICGEEGIACEVKSVDGFQGREKEVIIISFVRSNTDSSIGFLKDKRRLNVAMTRAKKKLIMIGDKTTLEANDPFDRLFNYLSSTTASTS